MSMINLRDLDEYILLNKKINKVTNDDCRLILSKNDTLILPKNDIIIKKNPKNYNIICALDKGTFSNVYICKINNNVNNIDNIDNVDELSCSHKNNINKSEYAIKIYKNSLKYKRYGFEELSILLMLNKSNNTNIIKLLDYFHINNHICLVLTKYDMNIRKYYTMELKYTQIKLDNFLLFIKDMCKALIFLDKNNIINSDIKPENILIDYNYKKKIINKVIMCDFSSILEKDVAISHYNYTSLWYRAPEIYYNFSSLNYIDYWSFGCVLFELWYKKPLFKLFSYNIKKENLKLQEIHINKLGYPPQDYIEKYKINNNLLIKKKPNLSLTMPNYFQNIINSIPYNNIIYKLLEWEPLERITPQEIIDTYFSNK